MQQSKGFESKQKIFSEEFELVTQALFTDPSDQSGWFYHLWLLAQTSTPENPQLIASWPCNGAELFLSLVGEKAEQNTQSSIWCYSLKERIVPIVLYFNEPVKGLNPSNVKLESDLVFTKDVNWKPLSVTDYGYSNCWATHLEITNECNSPQQFSIEVSIPCSNNIVSRSGSHYNCPVQFMFSIELVNRGDAAEDINLFHDPISWNSSEPFQSHGNSAIYFDQLKITSALVQEDSTWHLERLSEEIDLFRELPDENRLGFNYF
jgi:geranylgeranyl transferase type-2 subunit alpha